MVNASKKKEFVQIEKTNNILTHIFVEHSIVMLKNFSEIRVCRLVN